MSSQWIRGLTLLLLSTIGSAALAQGGPPPPFAPLGPPPVPAANPQSANKIMLGTALFWDEQLSKTGTVACGTCHMARAGGADPRTVQSSSGSLHPGPDLLFNTADDIVGSLGVPRHDANGLYVHDPLFGMAPQVGSRQSQTMVNSAYPPSLFWDGRAAGTFLDPDSQQVLIANGGALENQALGPLVNTVEMAHVGGNLADMAARIGAITPLRLSPAVPAALASWIGNRSYPALFAEVYGSAEITPARIAMAMASYQRSLVSNQSPHDQQLAGVPGAMTQDELAGRQAYVQAGCARCHGGPLLSDNNFHYIGVRPGNADPGRFTVTGNNGDRGRLRTPPLRNIELSAPYFADGRFRTLEEVVDFYNRGGDFTAPNKDPRIVPLNLTPQQRAAIVSFLRRPLTDPRVRDESGPFARPALASESGLLPQPGTAGTPGLNGATPRLTAIEAPLAGSAEFTIGVDGARAAAAALAIVALSDPTGVNTPRVIEKGFNLSAQGSGSINVDLPNGAAYAGQVLHLRVYVQDAAAAGGWAATNSVRFQLLGTAEDILRDGFE